MTESPLQRKILLELGSRPNQRFFRNNCGTAELKDGRWIKFGLHPGSSDLIGFRTLTILPEHVGCRIAVFCGAEIKTPTGVVRSNQRTWQTVVRQFGGIAEVLRSTEDTRLITEWRPAT